MKLKGYQIAGVLGALASLFLIVFFTRINATLLGMVSEHFSSDQAVSQGGAGIIQSYFMFAIFVLLAGSVALIFKLPNYILQIFDLSGARTFFTSDTICKKNSINLKFLWISIAWALLMHLYRLTVGEPGMEGIVEQLCNVMFGITIVIFLGAIFQVKKNQHTLGTRRFIITLLSFLAFAVFVILGEEISWGQRIFEWEATGVFETYNHQQETNFHNFLNPMFRFIYPMVGLSAFVFLFMYWFFPKNNTYLLKLFFPHQSMAFIIFTMACASYTGHSETYEALFTLFLMLYSMRVFNCLKNKSE
ncbi:MAG: hypothetical protein RLZZ241_109 [Bacteroidota bacterium]|jgi:hypothetical protein